MINKNIFLLTLKIYFSIFVFLKDVDECEEESMVCGNFSQCENSVGSYSCQCYNGYEGINGTNCKGNCYEYALVMFLYTLSFSCQLLTFSLRFKIHVFFVFALSVSWEYFACVYII